MRLVDSKWALQEICGTCGLNCSECGGSSQEQGWNLCGPQRVNSFNYRITQNIALFLNTVWEPYHIFFNSRSLTTLYLISAIQEGDSDTHRIVCVGERHESLGQ